MDNGDNPEEEAHEHDLPIELQENVAGEELELLNFDLSQNNSVDNYIDARDDEAEVMMNERNDSEEEIPNHYQNEEENVVEQNNVPQAFRWREQVLHFFHRRHPFRGRMQDLNLLRYWVERRRTRMRPLEGSSSDDNYEDEDGTEDQKEMKEILKNINFDKNLPTVHSYLGEMEECSGVPYQDQDTYQTLSVLYIHDFVLIPGQMLPLLFGRPSEVNMMRQVVNQSNKTFGILTRSYNSWQDDVDMVTDEIYDYGCTAEIRSFQDQTQQDVASVKVVVVGRQKFKIIEKRRQIDGNILAKVKILEDVHLPDLCQSVGLCNGMHKSGSLFKVHQRKFVATRRAARVTALPSWLYRLYDVEYLRLQIFNEMREWNQQLEERHCPEGASEFSFWVITNLPTSDYVKLHLLRMNSAVQRLRCELHLFRKCTMLACSDCGQKIAHRRDVFSMSVSGPMAAYVNPGGIVHETLTLHKATGIEHRGRKSTEHSWFPGYAWTICECRSCGRHVGWKFSATKSSLKPQKFWGLTRTALKHMVNNAAPNEQESSNDSDVVDMMIT